MPTPKRGTGGSFVKSKFDPMPIDIAILKLLPDDGAKIGKYLWDAKTSLQIAKELGEGVDSVMASGRVRMLRGYGLARIRPLTGRNTSGWQRTAAGKEYVEK